MIDNKPLANLLRTGITTNRLNLIKDTAKGDVGNIIEPAIEVYAALIAAHKRVRSPSLETFAEENTFKAISDVKARRGLETQQVDVSTPDKKKEYRTVLPFKPKSGLR